MVAINLSEQRIGPIEVDPWFPATRTRSTPAARLSPRAVEGRVGYRDPYGNAAAAARAAAGIPRTATAEDFNQFLAGTAAGEPPPTAELGYLGGFPAGYVSRTHVGAEPMWGAGRLAGDMPRNTASTLFGRPLYRENAAFGLFARLDANGIRAWQQFFAGLGFKTGPSGTVTQFEIDAMEAFMGMANGIPGGGMRVETLRERVMEQVRAGVYFFRGVNEEGDLLPAMLGQPPADDLTGTGGGAQTGPGFTEPITETVTRNIVQEFNAESASLALRNVIAQEIGRRPNDDEVKEFVRQMNAAFRADPTVITQVTTYDPVTGEKDIVTTEDETDVNPEGAALEFAEDVSPEERKEYQTGRFFDTLMSAIGM